MPLPSRDLKETENDSHRNTDYNGIKPHLKGNNEPNNQRDEDEFKIYGCSAPKKFKLSNKEENHTNSEFTAQSEGKNGYNIYRYLIEDEKCGSSAYNKFEFSPRKEENHTAAGKTEPDMYADHTVVPTISKLGSNERKRSFTPTPSTSKDSNAFKKNELSFQESLQVYENAEIIKVPCETIIVDDDGSYECVVTNKFIDPHETIIVDDDGSYECVVTNKFIDPHETIIVDDDGSYECVVTNKFIDPHETIIVDDDGSYECVVTNKFIDPHETIIVDDDGSYECVVTNKFIDPHETIIVDDDGSYECVVTNKFIDPHETIIVDDDGSYECVVTNKFIDPHETIIVDDDGSYECIVSNKFIDPNETIVVNDDGSYESVVTNKVIDPCQTIIVDDDDNRCNNDIGFTSYTPTPKKNTPPPIKPSIVSQINNNFCKSIESHAVSEGGGQRVSGLGDGAILQESGAIGRSVKRDDSYKEEVKLGLAHARRFRSENTGSTGGVPSYVVVALRMLLKVPGYREALLRERRQAIQLLRLVRQVTDDDVARNVVLSGAGVTAAVTDDCLWMIPRSLGTLPFRVLCVLLENAERSSLDGTLLRMSLLAVGAVSLVVDCLAVLAHHQPETPPGENKRCSKRSMQNKIKVCWAPGTGYGTGSVSQSAASKLVRRNMAQAITEEEHVTVLLQVLASYIMPKERWPPDKELLECADREANELPSEFIEVLLKSALVPTVCSYLRNDSVLDMSRHIPLYMCVLRCARAIWSLRSRVLAPSLSPVLRLLRQMSVASNSYTSKLKMSQRLVQGKTLTHIVKNLGEEKDHLAVLTRDIHETALVMCRSDSEEQSAGKRIPKAIAAGGDATREATYLEVMKSLQFESFEMMQECPNGYRFTVPYHYEREVRASAERCHPARMKRLAQEAATLSTSLPLSYGASVFVRTDTDRLDVMKVLIVGPPDTPYSHGCFLLDVYFPPNYPSVPLQINLETTGRHTVRFNPNLYNNGKVCLSVLNTWQGRPEEKWNAQTSSLLQVLVSIQALILVPEPFFNEPGYERVSGGSHTFSRASREYNSNVMQACVRWAMLDHLQNPSPCFKQVIQTHFWIKRREVAATIAGWITQLESDEPLNSGITQLAGVKTPLKPTAVHLAALKAHYVTLQQELAKLPPPPGLQHLDETVASTPPL